MQALCWHGKKDVRVDTVPDPSLIDPRDAIIKITTSAICGSDLHLYNKLVPKLKHGDILGHEFMGEVVELGSQVKNLKIGDRVVVPFTISCGHCFFCEKKLYSLCDISNPKPHFAEKKMGHAIAGVFGYSHMLGGFDGGQAEYVRVPYADIGPLKVPSTLQDEQVLFLSDIFPTAYMAAENCNIEPGDTVAIWGCGPVGLLTIQCARMLGAAKIIAIDRIPERLEMARKYGQAEIINFDKTDVKEALLQMTNGRGPDSCVDAVGTEAHAGGSLDAVVDRVKLAVALGTDRAHALREAIFCCRKGGTVSIPGVYIGELDKIPFGAAMNKGLTLKMGQTHVQRYMQTLLDKIEEGQIDTSFIITHRHTLKEAPLAYKNFNARSDNYIKVILKP